MKKVFRFIKKILEHNSLTNNELFKEIRDAINQDIKELEDNNITVLSADYHNISVINPVTYNKDSLKGSDEVKKYIEAMKQARSEIKRNQRT